MTDEQIKQAMTGFEAYVTLAGLHEPGGQAVSAPADPSS